MNLKQYQKAIKEACELAAPPARAVATLDALADEIQRALWMGHARQGAEELRAFALNERDRLALQRGIDPDTAILSLLD